LRIFYSNKICTIKQNLYQRAWQGDDMPAGGDEEDGKWTRAQYPAPNQGVNYAAQAQQMRNV